MIKYYTLIFLWLLGNLQTIFSQNITFSVSENLSVCQATELKLVIKNNTSSVINTPDLRILMPCGTEYNPGTIIGGTEKTITNLSMPVFLLGSISPDKEILVKLNVSLTCAALPCLDTQQSFVFNANLTSGTLTKDYNSSPINTDSPNLVITGINNAYEEIPSLSGKLRKITIRNSRAGRTKAFIYRHNYDPHIDVSHDKGHQIGKTNTYLELRFDSVEFKKIGNRDAWFDFNESIDINENIVVTACSYDHRFVRSDYSVTWGCNNAVCQQNKAIANIRILDNDDIGNKITVLGSGQEPLCYENGNAAQKLTITKARHKNVLTEIQFKIQQPYLERGIIEGSLLAPFADDIRYFDFFNNECGVRVAKYAIVYVSKFNPSLTNTTFEINWQTGFCEDSKCGTPSNAWICNFEYRKECAGPGDTFYSQGIEYKDIKVPAFTGNISLGDANNNLISPAILSDGFKGILVFSFSNAHFIENTNDTFRLRIEIPKGIEIQNMDFLLSGKAPVKIMPVTGGRDDVYELYYLLPFDLQDIAIVVPFIYDCQKVLPPEVCSEFYASCICDEIVVDEVKAFGELLLDENCPEGQHPKVCLELGYRIECENIKPCYRDTLAGSFGYRAFLNRTSYGKVDADNNGIADDTLTPMPELYRLNHFVAGDSFDIHFTGAIVVDKPGSVFSDVILKINNNLFFANDSITLREYKEMLLGSESAIKTYRKKVRIKQVSTGKVFEFDQINELYRDDAFFFHLSADSLRWYNPGTNFPADYRYSVGDSIYMLVSKYIDFDVYRQNKSKIKLGQFIRFNYNFFSFVGNTPDVTFGRSPCDCDFPFVLFPEFLLTRPAGVLTSVFVRDPLLCDSNFVVRNIFDFSFGHRQNMPPPVGPIFPSEIRESITPKSIILGKSDDIEYGNLIINYLGQNFTFAPIPVGNQILYDFDNKIPASGKHSVVTLNHIFRVNLAIRPRVCINLLSGQPVDFKLHFDLNDLGKLYFPDSIVTKIQLTYPKPRISSFVYQKELTAFSNRFTSGFSITGPNNVPIIDNVFFRVKTQSGNLQDIRIIDTVTQRIYVPKNGYFQVGKINKDSTRHFIISGKSKSCGSEMLILEFGFDCSEYDNPAFAPCFIAMDTIRVNFPDGLVDMIIDQPENPYIELCDTTTQEVTFFNAGLGNAYDMKIQLRLPQGVNYIPGSGFLYFPARQRVTGLPLPDPKLNSQLVPEWPLAEFWMDHLSDGLNGAGFFPNNEFDIVYKAVTDCQFTSGLPIIYNINAKKGCGTITNRVTKNSPALNLEGLLPLNPININASLNLTDNCSRDEAEIIVSFPRPSAPDTKLVLNLPPDWQLINNSITGNLPVLIPDFDGKLYVWNINSNDSNINLKLSIRNTSSILCLSDLITIYVSDRAAINCIATGLACEVGSVAGLATIPLEINQSVFSLINARIEKRNGQINLFTELSQNSGTWYGPVSGIIFIDDNGNGIMDTNEKEITSVNYTDFNEMNKTVSQWTNLTNLSENDYCKLTIYIPAQLNCICEDIILPLNRKIEIFEADIMLCANETTTLGTVMQPGNMYQWNQAEGLSCTQCAQATFSVGNTQNNPAIYTKILTATNGSCQIQFHYNITVNPLPKLLSNPMTICKGDTITAITTSGVSYVWQGINIIQGDNQLLLAAPEISTTYSVTVTDAFGCVGSSNLDVKVVPLPEYFVLNDPIFCKDSTASLHVEVINTDFFSWTKGANRLSSTSILKPQVIVFENFVFNLEVANGPCRKNVEIPIRFYEVPEGMAEVEICEGSTYVFENQVITSPGKYCKVAQSVQGCDSTFCLNLKVRSQPEINNLPDSLFKEQEIDLLINGPTGFTTYTWTPSTALSCTNCSSPVTSTKDTITYLLEVTDNLGCKASKRIKILITDACISDDVKIPNAFSPNDDGINDFYTLGDISLCTVHLKVFNRWGNLVYEEANWNNKWNGKSQNGLPLPQGTYFVQLEFANTGTLRSTMVDLRKK